MKNHTLWGCTCLYVRVVTRYMGSGMKGLKGVGSGITAPGSGITTPGIGISGVFHWIKDQAFWKTKGIHETPLKVIPHNCTAHPFCA